MVERYIVQTYLAGREERPLKQTSEKEKAG